MTDPAIRDLLDTAAPDQPDLPPAARTEAVATRARAVRRRNGLVLAAAVAAVVGAGVAVPLVGSGGDDGGTPVATDPPPAVTAPPECPAEPVDVSGPLVVEALPDGAVSVRACPADFPAAGAPAGAAAPALDLPADPVVDGVDEFTAAVRALPAYTTEEECAFTTMMTEPWALVVSYPDGTSATLGGATRACASVAVAGVDRSAEEVLALFASAAGAP